MVFDIDDHRHAVIYSANVPSRLEVHPSASLGASVDQHDESDEAEDY
jgi:hypothetical protein